MFSIRLAFYITASIAFLSALLFYFTLKPRKLRDSNRMDYVISTESLLSPSRHYQFDDDCLIFDASTSETGNPSPNVNSFTSTTAPLHSPFILSNHLSKRENKELNGADGDECYRHPSFSSQHKTLLSPDHLTIPISVPVTPRNPHSSTHNSFLEFWRLILQGFLLAWEKPHIFMAYMGGFVARGDSIIITLFISEWVNDYYIRNGLCETQHSLFDHAGCSDAFKAASALSGIAQTFALVAAPFFGWLVCRCERKSVPFLIASIISFTGYFGLFLCADPVSFKAFLYPMIGLVGVGEV